MNEVIFFDGEYHPLSVPLFSIEERSFQFGDGVFTSLKVSSGIVEHYYSHLERLKKNASVLKIDFPLIHEGCIQELIFRNQAQEGTWRLKIIITSGQSSDFLLTSRRGKVLALLKPFHEPEFLPIKAALYPQPIVHPFAQLKTLAYLDRFAIKQAAVEKGFDEMVTLSPDNYLLETATGNIFWIHKDNFYTPSPELPLLYGVALQKIEEAVSSLGFKKHFTKCSLDEIPEHAHVYFCNSLLGFRPITFLAGRTFPRNEEFENLLKITCEERLPYSSLNYKK